jgi:hypothetical protein
VRSFLHAFAPWAGLAIGVVAVAFVHQFGSEGTFAHCSGMAPGPVMIAAAFGLIVCVLSGFASFRSLRSEAGPRRVVAAISVGCSALFAFAIILPVIAASILPRCFQ